MTNAELEAAAQAAEENTGNCIRDSLSVGDSRLCPDNWSHRQLRLRELDRIYQGFSHACLVGLHLEVAQAFRDAKEKGRLFDE